MCVYVLSTLLSRHRQQSVRTRELLIFPTHAASNEIMACICQWTQLPLIFQSDKTANTATQHRASGDDALSVWGCLCTRSLYLSLCPSLHQALLLSTPVGVYRSVLSLMEWRRACQFPIIYIYMCLSWYIFIYMHVCSWFRDVCVPNGIQSIVPVCHCYRDCISCVHVLRHLCRLRLGDVWKLSTNYAIGSKGGFYVFFGVVLFIVVIVIIYREVVIFIPLSGSISTQDAYLCSEIISGNNINMLIILQ